MLCEPHGARIKCILTNFCILLISCVINHKLILLLVSDSFFTIQSNSVIIQYHFGVLKSHSVIQSYSGIVHCISVIIQTNSVLVQCNSVIIQSHAHVCNFAHMGVAFYPLSCT